MPPFEEERAYCFAHVGLSVENTLNYLKLKLFQIV